MKPTLIIMAAGMGSRYGGLKQMAGVGPSEETIMDYSVYDAAQAGFGKVVFVIRRSFEEDFRNKILNKYDGFIQTEVVFQELTKLPAPYTCPPEREKPWGTNHAVLMAKEEVREPFCVINADDFYGREAFVAMAKALQEVEPTSKDNYFMVAYSLGNTLSESGTVSRGVCSVNSEGCLEKVEEQTALIRKDADTCWDEKSKLTFPIETPVSMNFWGFTPDYFTYSEEAFKEFLSEYINEPKKEFYIPFMVDLLIHKKGAKVHLLTSEAQWFGVTYPEDREAVVARLKSFVEKGKYPSPLFQKA
ncbi:nucleotidyltransferase family protein [Porphyromonas circumdentaria]|uniref:nucleotidyltransferase family protein n=1 Tax=Porphyromonas circumdentaria TaxID=29524 RepID=UPI0026DA9DD9|nr:sugar phosphate nucleotidyltransferase [Porphyromonas circumdentaria]MDO4722943.1 sugar phosphate nucleotidyltransferase [Porphyromonas circumdentaria]